jgi:hypothetical protein
MTSLFVGIRVRKESPGALEVCLVHNRRSTFSSTSSYLVFVVGDDDNVCERVLHNQSKHRQLSSPNPLIATLHQIKSTAQQHFRRLYAFQGPGAQACPSPALDPTTRKVHKNAHYRPSAMGARKNSFCPGEGRVGHGRQNWRHTLT